ncbi:MAG: DNA gyrase inhibitor YacG [Chromatiales bacterium 21-64-14]|nr:MAG: DNA gyrase inhibitor YacG [Chromatiales bacterium 21-64-14]HQU14886.1 DNA gyrase inhibitor YacG [Gammaproteobacteria bacterium]
MSRDPTPPPTVQCPTCGRRVEWSARSPWRPFCSDRCRLIDLGAWLDGSRAIPGAPVPPESAEDEVEP